MDDAATLFTLFYIVCSFCFTFKTNEFVSLGLTVETLLGHYLGSEFDNFVLYQIKRSSFTLFVHSTLLLEYRFCLSWVAGSPLWEEGFSLSNLIAVLSLILPIISLFAIHEWWKNDWEHHPISRNLALFCDSNTGWRTLASDINVEFRRVDKMKIRSSSLVDVVVTDNWIMKIGPYGMQVAHQSDAALSLASADTHELAAYGPAQAQFLDIRLSFSRAARSHHFFIRLNALDFRDLENKLRRPVEVAQNIVFHRSRTDQFVDVFREQVVQNPPYHPTQEVELCIGCMVNLSDVKLTKNCGDGDATRCTNCYCRPMWCVACMARWFASRQEEARPEQWLASECTCPVCRAVFCVLDVSPVHLTDPV